MVESIYVQAFKRRWTKIKLRASYYPFRCSQWSAAWPPPCLSIVLSIEKEWWASWWRWSLNSMWLLPHSSFKSFPMLSMLLSVEELESLVIPYCHVFENILHFLAFVNLVVLQLLLIMIKPWFQSFIISSSPTSISSLLLPHLPQFFSYFQNRTCTEIPFQV
jgi:hypothetical protein